MRPEQFCPTVRHALYNETDIVHIPVIITIHIYGAGNLVCHISRRVCQKCVFTLCSLPVVIRIVAIGIGDALGTVIAAGMAIHIAHDHVTVRLREKERVHTQHPVGSRHKVILHRVGILAIVVKYIVVKR